MWEGRGRRRELSQKFSNILAGHSEKGLHDDLPYLSGPRPR